jgi:hypothetical protein
MNLKTHLCILTAALIALAPWQARAQSGIESDPAFLPIEKALDLKAIRPEVNVNLPRFLLMDAVSELNGGTNDPFAAAGVSLAELVKDVKLIRVVVIDTDKTNHAALAKGVATLRTLLETKWTPVATVPDDNVGIYAMSDASGESMTGLALLIHDDGDAVIANIVGRVSLGKLVKVASNFDKFPKDLLKKLGGADAAKPNKPEPAPAKSKQ